MKKNLSLLLVLIAAFIILATGQSFSQEKMPVKVRGSEVVTGVVIVHVLKEAKSLELQCNEASGTCKVLSSGNYLMLELPKGYGMYDCKNVEIYQGDPDKPEAAQKVGDYCLVE